MAVSLGRRVLKCGSRLAADLRPFTRSHLEFNENGNAANYALRGSTAETVTSVLPRVRANAPHADVDQIPSLEGRKSKHTVFGVYLLETREIWTPRVGNAKGIGLAAAPHELGMYRTRQCRCSIRTNCFLYRTVSNPSGSALAPSSVKMNGTRCAIDPEMKAPSPDAALAQTIALPSDRAASSVRRSWTRL